MPDKTYKITDCWHMHGKHPETFDIPTPRQISKIKEEDFIKGIFTDLDGEEGERMWVEVTEIKGEGDDRKFHGTLANNPYGFPGLSYADEVIMEPKHIAVIMTAEERAIL